MSGNSPTAFSVQRTKILINYTILSEPRNAAQADVIGDRTIGSWPGVYWLKIIAIVSAK